MVTALETGGRTTSIVRSKLLLVEGRDEENFFSAMLNRLSMTEIQVMEAGGRDKMPRQLKAIVITPGFESVDSIGIVRDANSGADAAFRSVCGALRRSRLPIPIASLSPVEGPPRVTVMILPPDTNVGALEDVCLAALVEYREMACVEEYVRCLAERVKGFKRSPGILGKAKVHAFLASQRDPDLRFGEAAQKGLWDFDHPAFTKVRQFLANI